MHDDSEYDAYDDFASLTEEDFALLDAASEPSASLVGALNPQDSAMPSIFIEVEGSHASMKSPIQRYRRSGTLSVTDLISLAWCEVQFDYGLRQKRFRKLEDRPPSFRAESGKEILVQQDVAAQNDKTTKRGKFIHKELELELRPEEIDIVITSEEERWALRLINFLSSLVSLGAEGVAREIPVFGTVDGVVIIGIIDELLVTDRPGSETGTKRPSDASLPSPKRTCRSPSPALCEAELFTPPVALAPPPQCIRLIDTKTRRTDSLPSDEDAEPAQLQVMLYHRLLTGLLEVAAPFDFAGFWALVDVSPSAPFSPAFLLQATQILGAGSVPMCLEEVVLLLRTRLAELNLPELDHTLEIIYRPQFKYKRRKRSKSRERTSVPTAVENEEIAKAIARSLEDAFEAQLAAALKESALMSVLPAPGVQDHGPAVGLETPPISGHFTPGSETGEGSSVLGREPTLVDLDGRQSPAQPQEKGARSDIIGTKDFLMDDLVLDAYLHNALEWWRGARKPRGVSDRQTGRCFSCEYREGCEWREQKASEKLSEVARRRGLQRATS
ncbi:exonuclease V [Mycena capillaripes]|nr:exonuclease V [Mycena capillaripes]